jgi:hypothetical protein
MLGPHSTDPFGQQKPCLLGAVSELAVPSTFPVSHLILTVSFEINIIIKICTFLGKVTSALRGKKLA